jgi:hypothetical protein
VQVIHLYDEMVEASGVDRPRRRVVDEFEADEDVVGQLSIVKLPNSVSDTVPTTSWPRVT